MIFALTTVFIALLANIGGATASPTNAVADSTQAAPFGINIGTSWNNNVAWVDGQSKCNNVVLGPLGANPCSRPFAINGQNGFTYEGCGGDTLWINKDGQLFANCGPFKEGDACGVKSSYHCI